jgi:hypothetical protein
LFTALVALREVFIWFIGLGKGKESEGGACEGKEMAYVLYGWGAWLCDCRVTSKRTDLFYPPKIMYLAGCAG